jgi:outer membrane protein assembly factor BamD
MKKTLSIIILAAIALYGISSCSDYEKLLKSNDYDKKYHAALKYYDEGECSRTLSILEELIPIYKATARAETIYYYHAYSNYCVEDYVLAAYFFRNFVKLYPNSKHAEECAYMNAYCFYQLSPRYTLDQEDTKMAIKEMQSFINRFPNSSRIEQCNKLIDQMRGKLEKKYFEIARQYYHTEDYKAAITAFQTLLKDFPDTKYREEVLFLSVKSSYRYAKLSVVTKQEERYSATVDFYYKFVVAFPQSKYANEVEGMFTASQKAIEEIKITKTKK